MLLSEFIKDFGVKKYFRTPKNLDYSLLVNFIQLVLEGEWFGKAEIPKDFSQNADILEYFRVLDQENFPERDALRFGDMYIILSPRRYRYGVYLNSNAVLEQVSHLDPQHSVQKDNIQKHIDWIRSQGHEVVLLRPLNEKNIFPSDVLRYIKQDKPFAHIKINKLTNKYVIYAPGNHADYDNPIWGQDPNDRQIEALAKQEIYRPLWLHVLNTSDDSVASYEGSYDGEHFTVWEVPTSQIVNNAKMFALLRRETTDYIIDDIKWTDGIPKWPNYVNVRDFGAKGDGVTDDTAAIQAAIDSISQTSITPGVLAEAFRYGGTVLIPKGKYRTTSTIYLPAFVTLVGESRIGFGNLAISAATTPGSTIWYDPTDKNSFAIQSGNFVVATGARYTSPNKILGSQIDSQTYSEARDIGLMHLTVAAATTGILGGIHYNGAANSQMIDVASKGFGICISSEASWSVTFHRIHAETSEPGGVGVYFGGDSNGISVDQAYSTTNQTDGTAFKIFFARASSYKSMIAEKSYNAFHIESSSADSFLGVYAEKITNSIFYIQDSFKTRISGIYVGVSPDATLVEVDTGLAGGVVENLTGTVYKTFKLSPDTTNAQYISLIFKGIARTVNDAIHVNNDSKIKYETDAKTDTLLGTQYRKFNIMDDTLGSEWNEDVYMFDGTEKYMLRREVDGFGVYNWSSGARRFFVDVTNNIISFGAGSLELNDSTGTKIGTNSTTQKLGFWNKTPITKPSGSIKDALDNVGLVTSPTIAMSEVTGLEAALAAIPIDSSVVHKTGDETIAGIKTFTSAPIVPNSSFPQSAVTNLATDLSAKAVDSDVVHKTGTETIAGSKTFSDIIHPNGGMQASTTGFTAFPTGGTMNILNGTSGFSKTPVSGTIYWASVFIPMNITVSGINYQIGNAGGTDKVIAALYDSTGTLLRSSNLAGVTVGSANTKQQVPLTSPIAIVGPGVYYIALQFDGTTARFMSFGNNEAGFVTGSTTGTFGTVPSITPGTTFSANTGPFASTY